MPVPTFRTPGRPIFKTANLLGDCAGPPGPCEHCYTLINDYEFIDVSLHGGEFKQFGCREAAIISPAPFVCYFDSEISCIEDHFLGTYRLPTSDLVVDLQNPGVCLITQTTPIPPVDIYRRWIDSITNPNCATSMHLVHTIDTLSITFQMFLGGQPHPWDAAFYVSLQGYQAARPHVGGYQHSGHVFFSRGYIESLATPLNYCRLFQTDFPLRMYNWRTDFHGDQPRSTFDIGGDPPLPYTDGQNTATAIGPASYGPPELPLFPQGIPKGMQSARAYTDVSGFSGLCGNNNISVPSKWCDPVLGEDPFDWFAWGSNNLITAELIPR